jgi:ubiquinone/menaquinone biosynthesis C-methylase UbiE
LSSDFQDHFSDVAADYAAFRPTYPDALFDQLAALCPQREVAWDCGAGNGQASASLARRFRRVLASDRSASQVASAQPRDNVLYHLAAAEQAAISSGAVDLVTVAQALHWFAPRAFFAEVHRVLKPDGIFAAWCYTLMEVDESVDPTIHQFYYDIVGPYWPLRRELVEGAYRSLDFPFVELARPEFHMEAEWSLEQLMGYLGTWSAVRNYRQTQGEDPRAQIAATLKEAWLPAGSVKTVRWPLHVRLGGMT